MNEGSIESDKRHEPYDLSEEASKRPEGEKATIEARQAESDDVGAGPVDRPEGDSAAENRVSTSLSDD
ncbi:MAG TPA: hypothetical protein VFR58_18390 [Flavisolibacter sp.]|nr:hypothetical protein [Flavisolibacter sp.]